jgi:uncharacterized CHY-type Zn-finger protein
MSSLRRNKEGKIYCGHCREWVQGTEKPGAADKDVKPHVLLCERCRNVLAERDTKEDAWNPVAQE